MMKDIIAMMMRATTLKPGKPWKNWWIMAKLGNLLRGIDNKTFRS